MGTEEAACVAVVNYLIGRRGVRWAKGNKIFALLQLLLERKKEVVLFFSVGVLYANT